MMEKREERNMSDEVLLKVCRLFDLGQSVGQVARAVKFDEDTIVRYKRVVYDISRLENTDEIALALFDAEGRRHRLQKRLNDHGITAKKYGKKFVGRRNQFVEKDKRDVSKKDISLVLENGFSRIVSEFNSLVKEVKIR
ncbi:MAG: hypothetical protein MUP27_09075 [Desulfobacterales bacterium]|nr:hypothetical protein [Desulfobacterales bacterium]